MKGSTGNKAQTAFASARVQNQGHIGTPAEIVTSADNFINLDGNASASTFEVDSAKS